MTRRPTPLRAIPTRYRGALFRSRLEAQWAALFDTCAWPWVYEPDIQAGFVIPDFLVTFPYPVVIEVKPATSVTEVASYRRALIGKMTWWLEEDVQREVRALDHDEIADLADTDRALYDLVRVQHGENPRGYTRRALVGGVAPLPAGDPDRATLDGEYGWCLCSDARGMHAGLATLGGHCLACLTPPTAWVPSSTMLEAWCEAGAKVRWVPGRDDEDICDS